MRNSFSTIHLNSVFAIFRWIGLKIFCHLMGFQSHYCLRAPLSSDVKFFSGTAASRPFSTSRQAREFSCPGFHDKQQNSLPMHCNEKPYFLLSIRENNSLVNACTVRTKHLVPFKLLNRNRAKEYGLLAKLIRKWNKTRTSKVGAISKLRLKKRKNFKICPGRIYEKLRKQFRDT